MSDFIKALGQLLSSETGTVPEGWRTAGDMAREEGMGAHHMRNQLNRLVEAGLYERKKFKISNGSRVIHMFHYRPAGKKK